MQFFLAVQAGGGGGLPSLILFVPLLFLMGYMFYSNQRRQKKWQQAVDALKTGDRVTTSGGLRGTIVAIKDDAVHLRVPPDNLRVEITKASVAQVTTADEEAKTK
jgi:preprotein translocase subunit YajC